MTTNNSSPSWYIVKQQDSTCKIIESRNTPPTTEPHWGPFANQEQAIAKRIGLIRAEKCQPQ